MIKYTGNDIITRAEQIADLENSDFISDEEKLSLLNESFQILYQKVIDSNDKLFVADVYAKSGMALPDDFFQLSALYVENTKEPISKINSTQKLGYEINNNRLYISPQYSGIPIVMEYVKIPPTIFIKEKTVDSPYTNGTVVAANDNIYVYLDEDENILIADVYSDTVVNLGPKSEQPFTDVAVFSNGILFKNENSVKLYRFDTSSMGGLDTKIPAISQDTIYLLDPDTMQVLDLDYNVYLPKLDITLDSETYLIYFDTIRTYQVGESFYICNKLDKVSKGETKMKCILYEGLYTTSMLGKLWVLLPDGIDIRQTEFPTIGIVSGKYVLTRRAFGNAYFLEGLKDSTFLDYPNNLFFVTLSYMLAIQFKIKQSADTTMLSSVYETVQAQFFESLNRDINQNYQVKNVYRNRGWIYG